MPLSASRNAAIALAAVCLTALMFGLEISSVPVILPILQTRLQGSFSDAQWVMNAYTIACTTVLMATGTLADRYGRKRMLMASLAMFGATSLACGLAQGMSVLVLARGLQGLGGGAMLICQAAILSHRFVEDPARARAFAIWGIVFGVGLGFGPLIGGAIQALLGWRWVFLIHVPLAGLTLLLAQAGVAESRNPHAGVLDLPGMLALSMGVLGLTCFIIQGAAAGWQSTVAVASAGVAAAACALFVLVQRRSAHPMFDASVFRVRRFSGALLGSVGMNVSFWPCMVYLPIYFQVGLGYDAATAGGMLLAYTLPALLMPPVAERLSLRYRPDAVIPAGLATIGAGFLLMYAGSAAGDPGWLGVLPGCTLAGVGLGLTNTPVTNTATAAMPSAQAGMASGMDMSARLVTLAINIAVMGLVLLAGIRSSLEAGLAMDSTQLRRAAESIASGDLAALAGVLPVPLADAPRTARRALAHGAGWVMAYGGLSALTLALASFMVFRERGARIK